MPGQSKLLEIPSASKKRRHVNTIQTSEISGDVLDFSPHSASGDSSEASVFSASDSESDDCTDFLMERSAAENNSGSEFEGIENRNKFSLNNDIKNVEQTVLDHFLCEVVLDDGVCEMHRPSCQYCRCLADCPRGTDPMVCPLQWKELFEDKMKNPKNYHQIMQYAKLYHTIYSEGTAIYLYSEEVKAMCKTHKNFLHVDRTFSIGPCFVTMLVFRNQNLVTKADKNRLAPLLLGPVLLHFDNLPDDTYIPFFEHIKQLCGITTTEQAFDKKSLKGIPAEHRFLYESMRRAFGNSVNFCARGEAPRQLHRMMKDKVTCNSKLKELVKFLYEQYEKDKQNVVQALNGCGKWRLSAHAQEVMTNASSETALKDFTAVEFE